MTLMSAEVGEPPVWSMQTALPQLAGLSRQEHSEGGLRDAGKVPASTGVLKVS